METPNPYIKDYRDRLGAIQAPVRIHDPAIGDFLIRMSLTDGMPIVGEAVSSPPNESGIPDSGNPEPHTPA